MRKLNHHVCIFQATMNDILAAWNRHEMNKTILHREGKAMDLRMKFNRFVFKSRYTCLNIV